MLIFCGLALYCCGGDWTYGAWYWLNWGFGEFGRGEVGRGENPLCCGNWPWTNTGAGILRYFCAAILELGGLICFWKLFMGKGETGLAALGNWERGLLLAFWGMGYFS